MFVKHEVVEMDESLVQRCVICGEVINNYRGAMVHPPLPPGETMKGFPAGSIYVGGNGWPTVFQTTEPDEEFINCNQKPKTT